MITIKKLLSAMKMQIISWPLYYFLLNKLSFLLENNLLLFIITKARNRKRLNLN